MRIISGKYKGQKIPFANHKYSSADVTTEKVKEAVFSILNQRIDEAIFADVFACSGQIAYEAASRGAASVYINEPDPKRFDFIKKIVRESDFKGYNIYSKDYKRFFKFAESQGVIFDIIYCDPPYNKKDKSSQLYDEILEELNLFNIYDNDTVVVFQHYTKNDLRETSNGFEIVKQKKYSNNTLTFYMRKNDVVVNSEK